MDVVLYGFVDDHVKLTMERPEHVRAHLRTLIGQAVEVIIRKPRSKRSDRANRYYWGVVVKLLAEFCGYQAEEMHEALKWKFLRLEADSPLPTVRSTTSLSTTEFEAFLENVRTWAGADLGVNIPLPNECEVP